MSEKLRRELIEHVLLTFLTKGQKVLTSLSNVGMQQVSKVAKIPCILDFYVLINYKNG
jgi:hypothetical protein